MTPRTFSLICAASLMAATNALAVNTCYLDDPGNASGLISPIQAGGAGNDFGASPTLCGHEVHGTNCVVQVNVDSSLSTNTDCLTLGVGVTVELQGKSIICTGSACGIAVKITNSGGSSSKVALKSGIISGCWSNGVRHVGSNATVDDVLIDLAGSGCMGGYGIGSSSGNGVQTVTHTKVQHVANTGITSTSNGTVVGSLVLDADAGIAVSSSGGSATLVDNCVVHDVADAIKRTDGNSTMPEIRDSVIYNASHCDFASSGTACTTSIDLTGTNFVEDEIIF